jgi:hypothetical protein
MIGKLHRKGTEPVNSQFHDEFVALGALFYAGELTDEEWALLQVHLAYCDTCRSTFEQYKYIASDVIPAMAASAAAEFDRLPRESESAVAEAERRLMSQLGAAPSPNGSLVTQKPSWRVLAGALAACAVVGVALASSYLIRTKSQPSEHSSPNITAAVPSASTAAPASVEEMRQAMERAQQEVTTLRPQLDAAHDRTAQPKPSDPALQHQLEADHLSQEQLATEKDALSQQLTAAQAEAQSLRDKIASIQENADQQAARSALRPRSTS